MKRLYFFFAAAVCLLVMSATASATTYFSQTSGSPTTLANWNTVRAGGGSSPANFTSGDIFTVQGTGNGGTTPHTMTGTATWTVSGAGSKVVIETGGKIITGLFNHVLTLEMQSGGTYEVNNTSYSGLTFGTLNINSNFQIDNTTGFSTTRTYPNLVMNQTTNFSYGGNITTTGNLVIQGTGEVRGTAGTTQRDHTIGGSVIISGGIFVGSNGAANSTWAVGGSLQMTSGTYNTGPSTGVPIFTFSGSSGSIDLTSAGTVTNSNHQMTINGTRSLGSNLPITGNTLTVNGTLNCATSAVTGSGTFTLASGGTLGIGSTAGITSSGATGNIQTTTRNYNAFGNYTYNGSAAQVTGNGLPADVVGNLTINNGAGVTLSQDVQVDGVLTLTTDLTTTNSFVLLEIGTSSGTGDVIGTVRRNDVGSITHAFGNPNVQITNGTSMSLTVYLIKAAPDTFSSAVTRTYTVSIISGTESSPSLRLHYLDSELGGNTGANLHLWRAEGVASGTWTDQGAPTSSSTASDPNNWIENNNIAGFSSWTLASAPNAPTAVKLTKFNAASYADGVQLNWESGFEVNNLGYHLYRDQNGKRTRVTPAVVAGSALTVGPGNRMTAGYSYSWFDPKGTADTAYYLEAIDLSGARQWTGPIYPYGGASKGNSPKHQRALLMSELAGSSTATAPNSEAGWAAAMKPEARRETLNLTRAGLAAQQSIAAGPAVKIQVNRTGWYRLSLPELIAAGFDPAADARLLQLYVDGAEVPIELSSNGPRLEANDTLEFYGVGLDTPTTDTRTYWLITGNSAGKRIVVKHGKPKPGKQNWTDVMGAGSFLYTTERREKLLYSSHLRNGDADNIFGAPVLSEPVKQTLTVSNLDRESSLQVQLEVALQGLTAQGHDVQVQFNGIDVGDLTFNSAEHQTATFNLDRALLRDGANEVSLVARNGDSDISLIDSIRLTYAHQYRADNNALGFSMRGSQSVLVNGFSTPNIRVIDVTDPNSPLEVQTTVGLSQGGFAVLVPAAGSEARTFVAFTDDLSRHASSVANNPSNWNASTNGADMVIITHRDFRQAIEPLAALRRSQGLSVAVIDVEDVYDEFSYGAHTPVALKSLLSRAASSWSRKPQYLLLVGDSTWDPRNYFDQGRNDFVPTKLIDTSYMETASDDWFTDFNSSGLPSMAIGRLPARSAAEVNLMVAKILTYEQERELNVPLRGAVMVSDNGFENETSQTSTLLPAGITVQTINRTQVGNDDLMRGQIVNALNQGPMLVNYYGHGSVGVWTGEALLDVDSAASLTNTNRLSLYVMMTCLNGYSHDAYVDSLGESALKAQNGGAVAVWASSGFTDARPQFAMDLEFYRQLFGGQPLRLGQAIKNSKAASSDPDVRRTWTLFGDPAMRLR